MRIENRWKTCIGKKRFLHTGGTSLYKPEQRKWRCKMACRSIASCALASRKGLIGMPVLSLRTADGVMREVIGL